MDNNSWDSENKLLELYSMCEGIEGIDDVLMQMDKPITYKNKLILYPIEAQFYTFFYMFVECLILPKHRVADINVIQMKYLDYLFYKNKELDINNEIYIIYLRELLLMCLRLPRYMKSINGEKIYTIEFIDIDKNKHSIRIENETYNGEDFENIRKLICDQNYVEMPDLTIHPDIERKYKEYKEFIRQTNKIKMCNFEGMILSLMAKTSYTKQQILKLSIRTFTKLLERIDFIMNYELTTLLSPDLDEKSRKNIKGWLSEIEKVNKLEEMSIDFDEMNSKIAGA